MVGVKRALAMARLGREQPGQGLVVGLVLLEVSAHEHSQSQLFSCLVILEGQNTTLSVVKMFRTRLFIEHSRMRHGDTQVSSARVVNGLESRHQTEQ